MRNRRNINCLATEELHDLREAFTGLFALPATDPHSFANLAGFHGGPPTAYCRHGAPGFFTWHRAYLMAIEDALRSIRCEVVLPYWDWSSGPSTGVPAACRDATYVDRAGNTVANPLYAGPARFGGMTSRRPDIDTTAYDDLAVQAQAALSAPDFTSFQNQINNVHGSVHVRTGGDMANVPTAAFDPIFYLHHANVDRLWASWQTSHPGTLPPDEASFALQPFNRPFSTQWQTGSDVESTTTLGYRYLRWCIVIPPIRPWEVAVLHLPWSVRRQLRSARLVVRTSKMQAQSVEVRAFVDHPRASDRTKTHGNPAFAGTIGLFGHAARDMPMPAAGSDADQCAECARLGHTHEHAAHVTTMSDTPAERFDLELDITTALLRADHDSEDVPLKLVAVDQDGNPVKEADLALDSITLEFD
jgi:hypothetical protein